MIFVSKGGGAPGGPQFHFVNPGGGGGLGVQVASADYFCQFVMLPVENLCISEASLHFRRPAPTWSMRKRVTYRAQTLQHFQPFPSSLPPHAHPSDTGEVGVPCVSLYHGQSGYSFTFDITTSFLIS